MQQITISGTLLEDAEACRDKNSREYVRIKVTCGETDQNGRTQFSTYHCICYNAAYAKMKKGDQVFISGKFTPYVYMDKSGVEKMSLNILVIQITKGYQASERKKSKI